MSATRELREGSLVKGCHSGRSALKVSDDGKQVSLKVDGFRKGRIYELHIDGVKAADGDTLLHPVGYYTLNEIPK